MLFYKIVVKLFTEYNQIHRILYSIFENFTISNLPVKKLKKKKKIEHFYYSMDLFLVESYKTYPIHIPFLSLTINKERNIQITILYIPF